MRVSVEGLEASSTYEYARDEDPPPTYELHIRTRTAHLIVGPLRPPTMPPTPPSGGLSVTRERRVGFEIRLQFWNFHKIHRKSIFR